MNDATHVGDATAKANLGNVHPGDSWAKISKSVFQLSPLVRHDVVRKSETLPPEAADATLSLIEITTLAESVLGSLEDAEQWLVTPAIGLDGRKPIDLISTRAGAEMVKTHLIRMDYGVYA
jgi:putative toxin-antitoxin system antitoxin component (TIGR02293 family)